MARYLIQSPHTPEECLQTLDECLAQGPEQLAKYDWGCMDDDHTCYGVIEAGSKATVESLVPSSLRHKARIVELAKFTPEQIKSFHGTGA